MDKKYYVGINCEYIDGKYNFSIDTTKEMTVDELYSVLVGGINLVIRCEKTPELQGKRLWEIIQHMERELINVDSFRDVYINLPKE